MKTIFQTISEKIGSKLSDIRFPLRFVSEIFPGKLYFYSDLSEKFVLIDLEITMAGDHLFDHFEKWDSLNESDVDVVPTEDISDPIFLSIQESKGGYYSFRAQSIHTTIAIALEISASLQVHEHIPMEKEEEYFIQKGIEEEKERLGNAPIPIALQMLESRNIDRFKERVESSLKVFELQDQKEGFTESVQMKLHKAYVDYRKAMYEWGYDVELSKRLGYKGISYPAKLN